MSKDALAELAALSLGLKFSIRMDGPLRETCVCPAEIKPVFACHIKRFSRYLGGKIRVNLARVFTIAYVP